MIYITDSFYVSSLPDTVAGGVTQEDVNWYSLFSQGGTISDGFGNTETLKGDLGPDKPRIGYNNLLIAASLSADFENIEKPASNIANVSTAEYWQSADGQEETEQHIYFSTEEYGAADYIGIGGHNLGTLGVDYVLQSRSGTENYQEIDLGGGVVGADIAIDAIDGNFQFYISVDGGAYELISVSYSSETNLSYTDFIADIDAELTGCSIALNGGNLRITSDTASPAGSIHIKSVSGINHFATYVNDYIGMSAVTGWADAFTAETAINDRAIFYQFDPVDGETWRLKLTPQAGTATPMRIAVIYVGRALILPRGIYVGHVPINFGRTSKLTTSKSENGQFLGRTVVNTFLKTGFSQKNLGPIFTRVHIDPFIQHAINLPFFFAWRPDKYPNECGFCWATGDINPSNQRANGMMEFSLNIEANAP